MISSSPRTQRLRHVVEVEEGSPGRIEADLLPHAFADRALELLAEPERVLERAPQSLDALVGLQQQVVGRRLFEAVHEDLDAVVELTHVAWMDGDLMVQPEPTLDRTLVP